MLHSPPFAPSHVPRHASKRQRAKSFAKEKWNKFTGHGCTHCVLVNSSRRIGTGEHRDSWFEIVYFAPGEGAEADTIRLQIEFCAGNNPKEHFTSAYLDVSFAHQEQNHELLVWHHKPVDEITVQEIHPSKSIGKPTAVHYRRERQTDVALTLNHDPIQGSVGWKEGVQHEYAYTTHSTVRGFGTGTPRAAWSFQEDGTVRDGIEAHYDLEIKLSTNVGHRPIHMKFFAQARTSSGHVLNIGTKEDPQCVLLTPPGQKMTGNSTGVAIVSSGRCLQSVVMGCVA